MNIHSSGLPEAVNVCFALGNTPPKCLTQDLPPEQSADILLLGCGDARNILFTCFADNSRKIDVTCCDYEPMIHARNVLLYTLLIDDKANQNTELIWNIYYHWKIDGNSMKLLESQVEKLLKVSDCIDEWHSSVYGSAIRFCDKNSLSTVSCYWKGFTSRGLSPTERQDWLNDLQAAIDRAKVNRGNHLQGDDTTGCHSLFPTADGNGEALRELCKATNYWWASGTVASSNSSSEKPTHLNPVFLYSPSQKVTIYQGVTPFGGIPLNTAYITLDKGSPFYVENKGSSSAKHFVNCVKSHFAQWAVSFRKAIENGSVIRVFSGHAFAFCFTLRNCHLTGSRSMNLFCSNWTNSPLVLNDSDYDLSSNSAPLNFDVIDTSNLADYFGPLNLVALASSLLNHRVSSCLYTQLMALFDSSLQDRITNLFGVDLRTMSFLLGLVPPELYTNGIICLEEYSHSVRNAANERGNNAGMPTAHSRLRWRRFGSDGNSLRIQVEAEELAKFLIQVHDAMFKLEDVPNVSFQATRNEVYKLLQRPYNRASFAFLLSVLKVTITTDWNKCLKQIQDKILSEYLYRSVENKFIEDMILNLHVFGVDSRCFTVPTPTNMNGSILASVLSEGEELPEQLCVTVRIPKEHLKPIAIMPMFVGIVCNFETKDHCHSFSSVQISFGKWHEPTEKDGSYPYIEEDIASGTCDMFASVMVPTAMLISMVLDLKQFVPKIKFTLRWSPMSVRTYLISLGPELCFFSCEITTKNVFITKFMPGLSGLPVFAIANQQDTTSSDTIAARFFDDGSKIKSLVQRITLKPDASKILAKESAVKIKFNSPLIAVVSIGRSLQVKFEFPVPVSVSKRKLHYTAKSSYIEIEAGFFDPVKEEAPFFWFPCFLTKTSCGIVPTLWNSMRIDLDVMPSVDLNNSQDLTSLYNYLGKTQSRREYLMFLSRADSPKVDLKLSLSIIFMSYSGYFETRNYYFCLQVMENWNVKTLIIPSCLRLDLANQTIVLDCALVPFTSQMSSNPLLRQFLAKLEDDLRSFPIKAAQNHEWKAMMPALVERCRTWKHKSKCEYLQAGEVPLIKGLTDDGESPICSCGLGKFPKDYLKDQIKEFPALNQILNQHATRVAISPIFASLQVEDCDHTDITTSDNCGHCGSDKRKNVRWNQPQTLFKCSKCKLGKYCSVECQKADWKRHKPFCNPEFNF